MGEGGGAGGDGRWVGRGDGHIVVMEDEGWWFCLMDLYFAGREVGRRGVGVCFVCRGDGDG